MAEVFLRLIGMAAYFMGWLIIARSLLSWFPDTRSHPIVDFIYQLTDPIILPIQKFVPRIGMIDISPMLAVIALWLLAEFLGAPTPF